MENLLQVGIISSTHGIRGEVKVFPTTSDSSRFKTLKEVILDTGKEQINLKIEGVKFFKQFAILKFKGFDNINEIEQHKGKSLWVTRENAVPLMEDEYYIADLIGMEVVDEEDHSIGILKDVIETGANDVYAVSLPNGEELLLPAIKDCILDINIKANRMKVYIMEGLM